MAVRHIPWPVGTVLLLAHPAPLGQGGLFTTAPGAGKALAADGI